MIRLTPYEQEMLDGKYGAAKQVALQKIIDYARILGAEELVPITLSLIHILSAFVKIF